MEEEMDVEVMPTPVPELESVDYAWLLEQMYLEEQAQTELLREVSAELEVGNQKLGILDTEILDVGVDVWLIFCLVLFSFCWSCMRGWRKATMENGK